MTGTVTVGQLYRDMAPDMKERDRRPRVVEVGNSRARLVIEHDRGGTGGKTTHASLLRLASRAFELVEDTLDEDPGYLAVLAAISQVHHPTPPPPTTPAPPSKSSTLQPDNRGPCPVRGAPPAVS
ncbi:hypothetical protein EF912_31345 [Streptomyces sp. WAC07061]|nr:hypothetical protein EF912_31345 [Streptomyces sp. WAC07061]